jgi:hypothetical protein
MRYETSCIVEVRVNQVVHRNQSIKRARVEYGHETRPTASPFRTLYTRRPPVSLQQVKRNNSALVLDYCICVRFSVLYGLTAIIYNSLKSHCYDKWSIPIDAMLPSLVVIVCSYQPLSCRDDLHPPLPLFPIPIRLPLSTPSTSLFQILLAQPGYDFTPLHSPDVG